MKHLWNFFLGMSFCLFFLMACAPVHPQNVENAIEGGQVVARASYNLYDVIRLILATFGGVATTILLTFLKHRYPKYFGTITIPENSTGKNDEKTG